jgi:uncharacterized membrane protein YhhN
MGRTKNGQRIGHTDSLPSPTAITATAGANRSLANIGLLLFALALAADLIFIAIDTAGWRLLTKPLIIPGMVLYFTATIGAANGFQQFILPALLFSWLGDVLLLFEDRAPLFFLLGLGAFLTAHIFYCLFLWRIWKTERIQLHKMFGLGVLVYYAGLLLLLWPHLGDLKIPVAVYGAVISGMLLLALHTVLLRHKTARLLMPGAVLFVLSDSVLATARFMQPISFSGIIVMLTYGGAQLLLVTGALAYIRSKEISKNGIAVQ